MDLLPSPSSVSSAGSRPRTPGGESLRKLPLLFLALVRRSEGFFIAQVGPEGRKAGARIRSVNDPHSLTHKVNADQVRDENREGHQGDGPPNGDLKDLWKEAQAQDDVQEENNPSRHPEARGAVQVALQRGKELGAPCLGSGRLLSQVKKQDRDEPQDGDCGEGESLRQ